MTKVRNFEREERLSRGRDEDGGEGSVKREDVSGVGGEGRVEVDKKDKQREKLEVKSKISGGRSRRWKKNSRKSVGGRRDRWVCRGGGGRE
jgi:hypothetical protein